MLATQDVCETEVPVELTLRDRLISRAKAMSMDQLMFARDAAEFAATNDYELEGSVSPIDWKSGNGCPAMMPCLRFGCRPYNGTPAVAG